MSASLPLISGTFTTNGIVGIGDQGSGTVEPLGRKVDLIQSMAVQLAVTAASGTTPTLNVFFQHSLDGGINWDDFISFTQATANGVWIAQWFRDVGPATGVHVKSDGTLAAGTVINGATGDDWRIKFNIGGTTPSFTFTVKARQIQRVR